MTTRKFAVSFPTQLHARARLAAERSGLALSTWLAQAAEHELQSTARAADGLAAIAELETEHGAITPSVADRAWVSTVLASTAAEQRLAG